MLTKCHTMPKKTRKKNARDNERMKLPNGCECTTPYIFPHNWQTPHASTREPWYLRFTFYDPARRPGVKKVNWEGMNAITDLALRQAKSQELLDNTTAMLKDGYNPIAKNFVAPEQPDAPGDGLTPDEQAEVITGKTPLMRALEWADGRATWTHKTRIDIRVYMTSIYPAIRVLRYDTLPLHAVILQHIENILAQAYKSKTKYNAATGRETKITWSNNTKNRAKDYLSAHFGVMKKKKVITDNPCSGIENLSWKKKKEDAYTPQELFEISRLLWAADPDYAIFIMLFYDSGARETEFMKLRKSDIDLRRQTFKREILKGAHMRSADSEAPDGVISDAALPYWEKLYAQAKEGDYLFSRGFRPGPAPIRVDIINKRWRRIVKPHFPESRPYLMKHTNLTIVTDELGDNAAIALAGWTTGDMLKVYDKRREQRNHMALKKKTNLHYLVAPQVAAGGVRNCAAVPCSFKPIATKKTGF
jgi:integrase